MNSQENTGEEGETGHRGLCQIKDSPDIINPYSEYAKGFWDGVNWKIKQELEEKKEE